MSNLDPIIAASVIQQRIMMVADTIIRIDKQHHDGTMTVTWTFVEAPLPQGRLTPSLRLTQR